MAQIDFEVKTTATAYWIAVDQHDVQLINGIGSLAVNPGAHRLLWWFIGNSGTTMTIIGKASEREVVKVTSTIPSSSSDGAGTKKFSV